MALLVRPCCQFDPGPHWRAHQWSSQLESIDSSNVKYLQNIAKGQEFLFCLIRLTVDRLKCILCALNYETPKVRPTDGPQDKRQCGIS
jgi:hypothetical protein